MLTAPLRAVFGAFYAYGASVHVLNMLSRSGFDWGAAPRKWQLLDVIYLLLDVAIVLALLVTPRLAAALLVLAAVSQIALYTACRDWVLDVPEEVAPPDDARARGYLNILVGFHVITLVVLLL